ncbi:Fic domain protein, PA0574 type [hydrothermal vent metagenome]|uniref:Fic domain protein, PA0574 type n=1 Tax=hydrothermal vent metagenome TaxID=652676 RepID=A0A3B0ZSF8_9ZZZZ
MISSQITWIWQQPDWPRFTWQDEIIQPLLRSARLKQGILLGKTGLVRGDADSQAALDLLLQNIITSSAIEGEQLNAESVRSSLAKRLGLLDMVQAYPTSNRSEGLADMMLDAVGNLDVPLTLERLFQWHRWLFTEDEFALQPVGVGQLRGDEPMQVVSGRIEKPTVHFEAPPRDVLASELADFIVWFNQSRNNALLDPLLRAAICHFWLITLHPFDDGNGRISRALADRALAQADSQSIRLYAMSAVILERRSDYYRALEQSQRGTVDITEWLEWFIQCLKATLDVSLDLIESTLTKTRFWQCHHEAGLLAEQIKVLNRLLDGGKKGFEEGISASQYQKVAKVSKATATRHLGDLLAKGCIEKLPGGGRNTRYQINFSE